MWATNAFFLFLGVYLFIKAAKESPVFLMVLVNKGVERLRQGLGNSPR
jgi:hypothetical protein